jgi:hypothetical protein
VKKKTRMERTRRSKGMKMLQMRKTKMHLMTNH